MGYLTLRKLYTDIEKLAETHPECLNMKILISTEMGSWTANLINEEETVANHYIYQRDDCIHLLSDDDHILSNEIPLI